MNNDILRPNESPTAVGPVAFGEDAAGASTEPHVIRMKGGEWPLWRWVGLRGAGFPVEQVLKLSSPESALAADRLLRLEDEARCAREHAVARVNGALDALRSGSDWEDRGRRDPLVKALRLLKMGKPAAHTGADATADAAVAEFRDLAAQLPDASQAFHLTYTSALAGVSRSIREAAGEQRFQEALIWQNRHAFHTAVQPYLRRGEGDGARGSKQRQIEELIANYLQRYCVKNDTIGFFGPVGWARLTPEGEAFVVRPGLDLLAERTVYLEVWCLDVLAEALARNESLRVWVAPRRMSFVALDGNTLHLPSKAPLKLPAEHAAVLQACDGERSAKEIARDLLANPYLRLKGEADVYELLELLCQKGLAVWKLEVPIESYPERTLRRTLERVEDEGLREATTGALAEIEGARLRVGRAAGDAGELDLAIGELEDSFSRLTGAAATRSAGEMYAGRTLVYEDCRRDLGVDIGPEVLDELGPPLSLVLTSARWFTHQVAVTTRNFFAQIYHEITRRTNSGVVDFPTFWYRLYPLIFGDEERQPTRALMPEFQERWAKVLFKPEGARRVAYTSGELAARVRAEFDVPDSGWKSAIYHSPDLMIAAPSAESIRRGDYQLVLGEIHASVNTLRPAFFSEHHASPGELNRFFQLDHPEPRAVPIIPKSHWPPKTARLLPVLVSPQDYRIEFAPEPSAVPPSRVLPFGTLVVEECEGELVVRTRDGRLRFDPLDVFSDTPTLSAANGFRLLPQSDYTPRITIDRLTVSRESWSFPAGEMPFAQEKTEAGRFLAARRWAQERGIPRFAFVKAPSETKPVFVDFDSPTYVDIFAKVVRRAKEKDAGPLAVTEMLPAPDESWLTDAAGQHYTSEFRVVAVDAPRRRGRDGGHRRG